ncbi:sigma 54-interacting transcriptional regulator [Inhella gelatinilytica]|uniref:HTH-type transcriptional regulatory protein TyrR n=1 Tax=Inhella gelatinilytica TaxID=2795030 RepID=A0A931J0B6_9BURK|nr:sigma 54-interacting transcriptional regulator [Inhella gelatinilytica]MBH9554310.1 sigma 54-interacting transcriptional regulator [Inhella gelatinilytica]
MQLRLITEDRLGITHEVLALIAQRELDLATMEMGLHNIYLNVPDLKPAARASIENELLAVPGVKRVEPLQLMPGEARRQQLDILLASLAQPVFVLDREGQIVMVSKAAQRASRQRQPEWIGLPLSALLRVPSLWEDLRAAGGEVSSLEVQFAGRAWLLYASPLVESDRGALTGAVVTLRDAGWLGEQAAHLQRMEPSGGLNSLLGDSLPLRELRARAERMAGVDAPLLILGETGTGKELIARACHELSARAQAPFLALNAAALPESLAESELFGYAPGAFSGAQRGGKPGLLEMAHGGTVFLDEIGEMSLYLQAKLLRFLNDGSFRRVGGEKEQKVDVRVISATHRRLDQMVARGEFREDLYYRLNVLNLQVAPLRERGDDVLLLAEHFIERSARQIGREPPALSAPARVALKRASWPGNIRQLQNLLFRAVTVCDKAELEVDDLDLDAQSPAPASPLPARGAGLPPPLPAPPDEEPASWADAVATFEHDLLARLYPRYPSSRKLAARLGISHSVIAGKLRRYGIG